MTTVEQCLTAWHAGTAATEWVAYYWRLPSLTWIVSAVPCALASRGRRAAGELRASRQMQDMD